MYYEEILENIRKNKIEISDLYRIEGIYDLFKNVKDSKNDILEVLKEKYEREKIDLNEEEHIALTKIYHKDIDTLDVLIKDIDEANKIRNLDVFTLVNFLEKDDSIEKIKKNPSWYRDENGDIAIFSRFILESNLEKRIFQRDIDYGSGSVINGISNTMDRLKTTNDIKSIYESFGMSFKGKEISEEDYIRNISNIVENLEKNKVSLDDVLVRVIENMKNNPYYKNSIVELLSSNKGNEILSFIERNGNDSLFNEFKSYLNYIQKNEIDDNLKTYINVNLLNNIMIAEEKKYDINYGATPFLCDSHLIDIDEIIECGSKVSSKEFEFNRKHMGYIKVDDKAKSFLGAYFDKDLDCVRILLRDVDNKEEFRAYEIDKIDFLEVMDKFIKKEFKKEFILEKTLDLSSSIDKRLFLNEFQKEIMENDFDIEL